MSSISVTDAAKNALSNLGDTARGGIENALAYLNSEDAKKLIPYLMTGGAAAVAGGVMTGKRKKRSGESRAKYLGRLLSNAATTGALGIGGLAALRYGAKAIGGSFDKEAPISGTGGNRGPLVETSQSALFHPGAAAATGLGTLAATRNRPLLGVGQQQDQAGKTLLSFIRRNPDAKDALKGVKDMKGLQILADKDYDTLRRAITGPDKQIDAVTKALAREAGLPISDPATLKGKWERFSRRGVGKLLGNTTGQRLKRVSVAGTAAAIPGLIGALLTNPSERE